MKVLKNAGNGLASPCTLIELSADAGMAEFEPPESI
jgi:hypothetical protein